MGNQTRTSEPWAPLAASSTERLWLRKLAENYYGLYLLGVIHGVVHNLNGPLQILYIRSEQLERSLHKLRKAIQSPQLAGVEDHLSSMEDKLQSCLSSLDDLNAQLRHLTGDLVGDRRSEIENVDINEVIEACLFLLNANMFFKHSVAKTVKLEDGMPALRGRKMDFCVIFLNLVQNAVEAMVDAQEKHLAIETYSQENTVTIRIQDTGGGIPEEDRERIYAAWFTTKDNTEPEGQSLENPGLGLTLVSLLVEDYNGVIACESVPGKTTFTVRLPVHTDSSD